MMVVGLYLGIGSRQDLVISLNLRLGRRLIQDLGFKLVPFTEVGIDMREEWDFLFLFLSRKKNLICDKLHLDDYTSVRS